MSAPIVAVHTGLATPTPIVMVSEIDGMEMAYVHAGTFLMGSRLNPQYPPNEQPRRDVYLDAFWMDRTEVTVAMFAACERAGACQAQADRLGPDDIYYGNPTYIDYPVDYVTWQHAADYCGWTGRRLPTEAEWEKAARGTDGRIYPWGDDFYGRAYMNSCDDCEAPPTERDHSINDGFLDWAPVGRFRIGASPYGVFNMAGNVAEWVADWWDEDYYEVSPPRNPQGPTTGANRVVRGGSYDEVTQEGRAARRRGMRPSTAVPELGFRCASSAFP